MGNPAKATYFPILFYRLTFIVLLSLSGNAWAQSDSANIIPQGGDSVALLNFPGQSRQDSTLITDSLQTVLKDTIPVLTEILSAPDLTADSTKSQDTTAFLNLYDSITPILVSSTLKDTSAIPYPVFLNTDQGPQYPGGPDSLISYLTHNLIYPKAASESGVSGQVNLRFIIDSTGRVCCYTAEAEPGGFNFEHEAVRLLMAMPLWIPAQKDGHPVSVYYKIPVSFQYQEE